MTSLRMPFQCDEVVIDQDDWIIGHSGLTLEYSSEALTLDGVYEKQKIDCLANG